MGVTTVFITIAGYFLVLMAIARYTSSQADTSSFFTADRRSPWYIVAFGMIGASLSGVTFISVPGAVYNEQFYYYQVVIGYLLGYLVIGTVLLPLYYRLNLVSIYTYLQGRYGMYSYKTGASFFLLSRIVGASFRLYLTATVLQLILFDSLGVPFWCTTVFSVFLIWTYTQKGGIKTIVWTDTLQTASMLLAVAVSIYLILQALSLSVWEAPSVIAQSKFGSIWNWEWQSPYNFYKQFLSGAFIAIVMTGLDQDMMQKNLTCRSLKDAQKNMFWFSIVLLFVNLFFLSLGALLYMYAEQMQVTLPNQGGTILTDKAYPFLAFEHFGTFAAITFLVGLIAATYSSADSALTSLTTSFSVDILEVQSRDEGYRRKVVRSVHIAFSVILVLVILLFQELSQSYPESNVIGNVFRAAGYTYGPLLGLYSFGLFSRRPVYDPWVPFLCILSPILAYLLNLYSESLFWGYQFGFEILLVNGFITFLGLWILSYRAEGN